MKKYKVTLPILKRVAKLKLDGLSYGEMSDKTGLSKSQLKGICTRWFLSSYGGRDQCHKILEGHYRL